MAMAMAPPLTLTALDPLEHPSVVIATAAKASLISTTSSLPASTAPPVLASAASIASAGTVAR